MNKYNEYILDNEIGFILEKKDNNFLYITYSEIVTLKFYKGNSLTLFKKEKNKIQNIRNLNYLSSNKMDNFILYFTGENKFIYDRI